MAGPRISARQLRQLQPTNNGDFLKKERDPESSPNTFRAQPNVLRRGDSVGLGQAAGPFVPILAAVLGPALPVPQNQSDSSLSQKGLPGSQPIQDDCSFLLLAVFTSATFWRANWFLKDRELLSLISAGTRLWRGTMPNVFKHMYS